VAVTVRQFKTEFPEFAETDNAVVQARLTMATRMVNSSVWGTKADDGVKLYTAHLLAMSPMGEQARLKKENRGTIYGDQFEAMKRSVASGFRVI